MTPHAYLLGAAFVLSACATPTAANAWQPLFDGETLSGWTPKIVGEAAGEDRRALFRAKDGVLHVSYDNVQTFDGEFGHLFYNIPAAHYRLRFEYQFTGAQVSGGPGWALMNSGVMVHAQAPETMTLDQPFPISIEAQLLGLPETLPERTTANICTPGTHFVQDGEITTQHCVNSDTPAIAPDTWVKFEIEVRGDAYIQLNIDGAPAYRLEQPQYDGTDPDVQRLGLSGPLAAGYFALQAESHPAAFRNIEWQLLD
ncbi:MAG: DUF1080 domain-containing protein [Pseudomonadota bacterium]